MPLIPVLNPQPKPRRTGGKLKRSNMARKSKKRRARPAKRRRVARRKAKRKMGSGHHRPSVTVRKGKLYRGKSKLGASRSRIPPHARFANPLAGELLVMGNPHRRRKRRKKYRRKRRKNPCDAPYKKMTYSNQPRAPYKKMTYKNRPRRRALTFRGAPGRILSQAQQIATVGFMQDAASAAVGFVLPDMAVRMLPPIWRDQPWKVYASKLGAVATITVIGNMWNRKVGRMIALGGGMSLALDLWTDFVAPLVSGVLPGAPGAPTMEGTEYYYGTSEDTGVGHYWGTGDDSGVASSLADTI